MVMADHDRINELQTRVAGLTLAVGQLINALSALATSDPALATALNEHVTSAKTVLAQAEQRADRAISIGEARWESLPDSQKRPDHLY